MAWKNIWRNKIRSMIILSAITLGLFAGILASGITVGMGEQIVSTAIRTRLSHIQITNPEFRLERDIAYYIPDAQKLVDQILEIPKVEAAAPRILVNAMALSPRTAQGIELVGVIPRLEKELAIIDESITTGEYLDEQAQYPVVIGEALAERLDVGVGSRLVLTFQDAEGVITGGAFRVSGLYGTPSTEFDRSMVYVPAVDLADHLGTEKMVFQQISVLFTSTEAMDVHLSQIKELAPNMRVETWRQLAPEMDYISETLSVFLYVFMIVILAALAFGIVNTMFMVVLERTREFGMLMAVGMKRTILFGMIVLETVVLSITGAIAGMLLSFIVIQILSVTGIDLSLFAEGLREFGVQETLYPRIPGSMYIVLSLMVIGVAVLAAIFPARKALKLKPAEALRNI